MTEKKHQSKAKQPLTEDSAKQESTVRLFNKEVKRSDLFKFLGLIGFFVLCIIVVVALLPLFKDIFEPGGVDRVIERIQDAGAAGVLVLLALQFIQVVVASFPAKVTQMAAGSSMGRFGVRCSSYLVARSRAHSSMSWSTVWVHRSSRTSFPTST